LVHIIYGLSTPVPSVRDGVAAHLRIKLEEDAQQFRGPAGAVRDACSSYPGDATVVVAEAARYVDADLTRMVAEHQAANADITVACNSDSTPAGIFVVRCSTLELVPKIGFTDLKEQWLNKAVEKGFNVRVHRLGEGHSYELRTRDGFLHAAAICGGLSVTGAELSSDSGFVPAEDETVAHSVASDVTIGVRAVVVDSVVMPGAVIGEDAIIARSILCPGAKVPAGGTVIESVVPAGQESVG
jgi:mannose-1-phosphate guanylyltransferase